MVNVNIQKKDIKKKIVPKIVKKKTAKEVVNTLYTSQTSIWKYEIWILYERRSEINCHDIWDFNIGMWLLSVYKVDSRRGFGDKREIVPFSQCKQWKIQHLCRSLTLKFNNINFKECIKSFENDYSQVLSKTRCELLEKDNITTLEHTKTILQFSVLQSNALHSNKNDSIL